MPVAMVMGGSGFIGRWLTLLLAAQGWSVLSVSRRPHVLAGLPDEPVPGSVAHVALDVRDAVAVGHLVAHCNPDVVFHLATSGSRREGSATGTVRGVVEATTAVFEGLVIARQSTGSRRSGTDRWTSRRPRVVLAGSAAQYGPGDPDDGPISEATPDRPVTAYGFAKAAAEAVAGAFAAGEGIDVIYVRPFNLVGPGESDATVAGSFVAQSLGVLDGDRQTVDVSAADAVRDFTDVRDVAAGCLAAAERGTAGRTYNLCSGAEVSVRALAGIIADAAGLPSRTLTFTPGAGARVVWSVGCPDRARVELGWAWEISLPDSVSDMVAEARSRAHAC